MVASFGLIRQPSYYTCQGAAVSYYDSGTEAGGVWLRGNARLGVERGAAVDKELFENLCAGVDRNGRVLVKGAGAKGRVGGVDITLSSPKSVSVLWAIADPQLRAEIAAAEREAVEATLDLIDQEIPLARRGPGGIRLEKAKFIAAVFTHSETRPELHVDGTVRPSPQRHHHVCLPSIVEHSGGWGAINSIILRSWKKALGAHYRLALATALQERGIGIELADDDWRWSVQGIPAAVNQFFSARRAAIEEELAAAGLTSAAAPALAAAITLRTRKAKEAGNDPTPQWRNAIVQLGYQPEAIITAVQAAGHEANRDLIPDRQAELAGQRLAPIPAKLTANQSTFERRDLLETTANALVGTKLNSAQAREKADRIIAEGLIVSLGETRDGPVLSTPEMIAIERELVGLNTELASQQVPAPSVGLVRELSAKEGLNAEQITVALASTSGTRLVAVQGSAGSGKSTTLRVVARAWESAGWRVIGSSVAWRAAHAMRDDLGIESRALDSWLARAEAGPPVFNNRTVVLVDEAALQSSPQAWRLLKQIDSAGAVVVLVGDEKQLRPIGPGHAMRIVREAIGTVTIETNVRQRDVWARDMVRDFAHGNATGGLNALREHNLARFHDSPKATVHALIEAWEERTAGNPTASVLLLAKMNAEVRALDGAVRERLKARGTIQGKEIALPAIDASGNPFTLRLAAGDQIRFLQRNDDLAVINGTEATIEKIIIKRNGDIRIKALRENKHILFSPADIADEKGRIRLAHAYAQTLFQAQGMTADVALVLASSRFDRHDAYVATSRARAETRLFINGRALDAELAESGHPLSSQERDQARFEYLAKRLARENIKTTTLDVVNALFARDAEHQRAPRLGLSHEL